MAKSSTSRAPIPPPGIHYCIKEFSDLGWVYAATMNCKPHPKHIFKRKIAVKPEYRFEIIGNDHLSVADASTVLSMIEVDTKRIRPPSKSNHQKSRLNYEETRITKSLIKDRKLGSLVSSGFDPTKTKWYFPQKRFEAQWLGSFASNTWPIAIPLCSKGPSKPKVIDINDLFRGLRGWQLLPKKP